MRVILVAGTGISIAVFGMMASAHPGRTDSSGGHNDRKHGGYHYHGGGAPSKPDPPPADSKPEGMTNLLGMNEALANSLARETARTQPRTAPPKLRTSQSRSERSERLGSDFQFNPETKTEDEPEAPKFKEAADPKDEARAQKLLDFAKRQHVSGKEDVAIRWMRRIISDYSKTSAAAEAETLLGEWKASEPFRTWKDATGKFNVIAKFIRLTSGKVYLHTQSDKDIAVEVKRLCRNDQEYVLNREGL